MNDARVKAQDLRLQLFERSVHPELFTALRRADLSGAGWRASLVISGQSHVVAVRAGKETVTEVMAPRDAALPRLGAHAHIPLGRISSEGIRRDDGRIRYASEVRVERLDAAAYRERTARLLARNGLDRLKAFFDDDLGFTTGAHGSARAPELVPFALIDWHAGDAGRLDVASVHACPHELTVVEVESRFEVEAE